MKENQNKFTTPFQQFYTPAGHTKWKQALAGFFSTVGFLGYIPKAPGTFGSLAALPFILATASLPIFLKFVLIILGTLLSLGIIHLFMFKRTNKDPSEVVLDEFVGCYIACIFLPPTLAWQTSGFILFRLLDITKPLLIGVIDRKGKGALGILGDDVLAGLLAGALLFFIHTLTTS